MVWFNSSQISSELLYDGSDGAINWKQIFRTTERIRAAEFCRFGIYIYTVLLVSEAIAELRSWCKIIMVIRQL